MKYLADVTYLKLLKTITSEIILLFEFMTTFL